MDCFVPNVLPSLCSRIYLSTIFEVTDACFLGFLGAQSNRFITPSPSQSPKNAFLGTLRCALVCLPGPMLLDIIDPRSPNRDLFFFLGFVPFSIWFMFILYRVLDFLSLGVHLLECFCALRWELFSCLFFLRISKFHL